MKTSAILLAVVLGTVAAPAFAASAGETTRLKATYDAKRDVYCVSQHITGQRIPVQDCRSKADWAADGATFGENVVAKQAPAKLAQR